MADGRSTTGDVVLADRPNGAEGEHRAANDEASQRARYLAKAASLGQVVLDDAPAAEG
jgi:hypothetical protein